MSHSWHKKTFDSVNRSLLVYEYRCQDGVRWVLLLYCQVFVHCYLPFYTGHILYAKSLLMLLLVAQLMTAPFASMMQMVYRLVSIQIPLMHLHRWWINKSTYGSRRNAYDVLRTAYLVQTTLRLWDRGASSRSCSNIQANQSVNCLKFCIFMYSSGGWWLINESWVVYIKIPSISGWNTSFLLLL